MSSIQHLVSGSQSRVSGLAFRTKPKPQTPNPKLQNPSFRGQINSIDLLIAFIIFVLIFAFLIMSWSSGIQSSSDTITRMRLQAALSSASDNLMTQPGVPSNWELTPSSVSTIGLSSYSNNVLNANKISNMTVFPYSNLTTLLGLSGYDFYLTIENLNGTVLYQVGNSSIPSTNRAVSVNRDGLLNGQIVRMRLVGYG